LSEDAIVSFSLEVNVEKAAEDLRKIQTIAYRVAGLLRRTGLLPKQIDDYMMKLQRAIMLMNQARLAAIAFHAAAGPIGWALAGVGFATLALDAGDFVMDLG